MKKYAFKSSKFQTYKVNKSSKNLDEFEPLQIFWTGGWDSSFRILQLSSIDVIIQPIYLDDKRKSVDNELRAIDEIANLIDELPSTRCTILDLLVLNTDEIERDDVITRSFASLSEKKYMGSQYDWLARFSKDYKGIELCVHKDDKANEIIEAFGSSIEINDVNVGKFYKIDTEASCVDLLNVFGNYNFPLLKMTKLEMKKEAERKGFKDALYRSWFCHRPINNLPCGICNPCIYSIEEGMRDRFNMLSLSRYRVKKFAKFIRALVKGV